PRLGAAVAVEGDEADEQPQEDGGQDRQADGRPPTVPGARSARSGRRWGEASRQAGRLAGEEEIRGRMRRPPSPPGASCPFPRRPPPYRGRRHPPSADLRRFPDPRTTAVW